MSPSEKRLAFLRRPQITPEAFSKLGEASYAPINTTEGRSVKAVIWLRIELSDASGKSCSVGLSIRTLRTTKASTEEWSRLFQPSRKYQPYHPHLRRA